MANVSSSNGLEKRPKLRFPGFDEPWKETALSSVLTERNEYAEKDGTYEHATLSKEGIYRKTARYDRDFLVSTENKKYKVTHLGDLCYNPANLKFGVICSNTYGDAIFSPIYVTFEIEASFDPDFIGAYLTRWDFINRALKYQQGTVYERMAVSPEDFISIKCCFPQKAEQTRLAEFITLLDKRIAAQGKYVESLKKYKRGLSNSLFDRLSAESESQLCIFGDMMTILQNNTFSRDNLSVGGNGVRNIHYGDVLIKYGAVLDLHSEDVPVINAEQDISKFSALSYLRNGDVVFADTAEDYTVGKATEIIGAENIAALSGLHTIPCRPQDSFAPMYLGYYFNSDYFKRQLYPMIQGTKVSSISKSEIIKTKIIVPCLQEQARIASIMSALDDRIDAAKHTTKDLIDLRSGLLQQLFI
jgi:type I restriction enzyme S subunit